MIVCDFGWRHADFQYPLCCIHYFLLYDTLLLEPFLQGYARTLNVVCVRGNIMHPAFDISRCDIDLARPIPSSCCFVESFTAVNHET